MGSLLDIMFDIKYAKFLQEECENENAYKAVIAYRFSLITILFVTFYLVVTHANMVYIMQTLKYSTMFLFSLTLFIQAHIIAAAEDRYRRSRIAYTIPQMIFYLHATIFYYVALRNGIAFGSDWLVFLLFQLSVSISFKEYVALKRLYARSL